MPMRVTCRYLRKDKLAHPPPLSEGEGLASRVLEMGPAGAKFLGPVIIEVPHFASLRGREREIVILRSDDGEHWKEHTLEATEEAVQSVLNDSFDPDELSQLEDLNTNRITRILTNDFPQYFAIITRVRQEVHAVGPDGGMITSTVIPMVQAVFPEGALTKTIKVSVQAHPVAQEVVTRLHGNRVALSPIVTVEPRRRKFHKPITLMIPLPQSSNKAMITQYTGAQGQEPPTLRLLCSITGGTTPAQWEDITGTTQLNFAQESVTFTTTVSARFWLMDCQTPRDAARMAQEIYNEAIVVPFMAKFVVFARRTLPIEGQLRVFCMTDDKEDKTLEKQEHFVEIAKSRDVEVMGGKLQHLEFAGNLVPVTKSGEQLSIHFRPFMENRLAFLMKVRETDDPEAAASGRIAFMKEPKSRAENLPPQHPICTLAITLPEYTGKPSGEGSATGSKEELGYSLERKYKQLRGSPTESIQKANLRLSDISREVGRDWERLARVLEIPGDEIRQIHQEYQGQEALVTLRVWLERSGSEATGNNLERALRRIGREDIVKKCMFNVETVTSQREKETAEKQLVTEKEKPRPPPRGASLEVSFDENEMHKAEKPIVEETAKAHQPEPDESRGEEQVVTVTRRQVRVDFGEEAPRAQPRKKEEVLREFAETLSEFDRQHPVSVDTPDSDESMRRTVREETITVVRRGEQPIPTAPVVIGGEETAVELRESLEGSVASSEVSGDTVIFRGKSESEKGGGTEV